MEFPRLQTPRVNLRLLTLDDVEAVFRHFADPRVTEFMDIDPVQTLEGAREILAYHLEDSGCRWGLFCRGSGDLVGTCGYHNWRPAAPATAEIGFDLAYGYWGMGLMREVLPPVLHVGFGPMGLARVEASVDLQNARCLRLLRDLGFREAPHLREGRKILVLERGA